MDALDMIIDEFPHVTLLCFVLLGACIGSFLNVVIYRLPRGMSVQRPARSICPRCGVPIPWYLNIPLVSWLQLRGRSACCGQPIAARYWLVELCCALLFGGLAYVFLYEGVLPLLMMCGWGACMLALLVMDWEEMVVHVPLALVAAGFGLAAAGLDPLLVEPLAQQPWEGLLWGGVGALCGYAFFRLVALLGSLCLGRVKLVFSQPEPWCVRQVGEDIVLSVGGREYKWSEVFVESGARVELAEAGAEQLAEAARGLVRLEESALVLPGGERRSLEDFERLSGTCSGVRICRSVMGSGDPWLALAIGSLCGWQGVLFSLVAGSFIGLFAALLMQVRRGQPMPFGPALVAAALVWRFWGVQLVQAYLSWVS